MGAGRQGMRGTNETLTVRTWLAASLVMLMLFPSAARALDPERDLHEYKHSRWTIADGAPQSIWALAQGADGYLWIGSSSGVFRFDGVSFELIPLRAPRSENWRATALLAAADGTIHVGYDNGVLATYRDGGLMPDSAVPRTGEFTVRFAQTRDGVIWALIGRKGRALLRYSAGRWQEVGDDWGLPDAWLVDVTAASDGSLWITTLDTLLRLRPGSHRFERIGATSGHAAVSEDRNRRIWMSDDSGSRIVAGHAVPGRDTAATPGARRAFNTMFDRDGNLWGMNGAGIFRMRAPRFWGARTAADRVERFGAAEGLSSQFSLSLLEDREGSIWVGTSLGLDRFRPASVIVSREIGPIGTWGYALLGGRNGDVYVGGGDGVYRVVPGGRPGRVAGTGADTHDLCEGPDGAVWAIQTSQVLRIFGGDVERFALPPSQDWRPCVVGNDNRLVLGGRGGLRVLQSGRWRHDPPKHRGDYPQFLLNDPQRRMLALMETGHIVEIQADGSISPPLVADRIDDVSTVYAGARHILLAGTFGMARLAAGRLQRIDGVRFPWMVEPSGLVQTPEGRTWLIGRQGIAVVASSDLDRAFADPAATLRPRILTLEDGLPNVYTRDGRQDAVRGGDGRLWFATSGGVVWVDPARLTRNPLPPPVAIRALTVGAQRYRDPRTMTLAKGTSNLSISYAGLSLATPSRVRFRYRLEGMDEDWIDAGTRRDAYYTNLGPGHYRFRVLAANDDGVWNHDGATLDFTIPPTFLQSVWFKMLLGLGGLALLGALYLLRLRQVTARLQSRFDIRIAERERIARELHDTLLQGFQGLVLQIKAGVNRLPDPAARQPLDEALKRAQAVLIEGRDRVLDLRAPDHGGDLSQLLVDAARSIVGEKGPGVQVIAEGRARELHPVAQEELQRIAEEALRNIVQHARAQSIEILLIWGGRRLSLSICDDGMGMPEEILARGERPGHFGLRGIRERAERIGGRLAISSRAGGGTEVALVAPGGAVYRGALQSRRPARTWLGRILGRNRG